MSAAIGIRSHNQFRGLQGFNEALKLLFHLRMLKDVPLSFSTQTNGSALKVLNGEVRLIHNSNS